jgi:hypothetical protein
MDKNNLYFQQLKRTIFLCGLLLCNYYPTIGQFIDSINYQVESVLAISNKDFLPHWIVANQYGILEDTQVNGLIRTKLIVPYKDEKNLTYSAGIDLIGRLSTGSNVVFLQQAYLKIKYKFLELSGGRMEQTLGTFVEDLSSGSLAISKNARPFPMVQIAVPAYTPFPFTNGYLEFKGHFGHAWFEKERYIEKPYLHYKSLYLKGGGKLPVNLYGGIVHLAFWGGDHPDGYSIPQGLNDYLKVILSQNGNSSRFGSETHVLGDHFGIIDYGMDISLENFKIKIYNQVPFEDGSGLNILVNKDRLLGIHVESTNEALVSGFLYEYIHTKYQSGPGRHDPPDGYSKDDLSPNYGYAYGGRDDYYNHAFYRTGWTYKDRIVGTSLFMTENQAKRHLDHVKSFDQYIVNNRIVGHHFGIEGGRNKIQYRLLATYTKNYGTYSGINNGQLGWMSYLPAFESYEYAFKMPLNQCYFLVETDLKLNDQFRFTSSIGVDTGEINDNFGLMLGVKFIGKK